MSLDQDFSAFTLVDNESTCEVQIPNETMLIAGTKNIAGPIEQKTGTVWKQGLFLFLLLFAFILSIDLMSKGFTLLGEETARDLIRSTGNPFVGLFLGLLATAIIQSSSVTTSALVAMVAAGVFSTQHDPLGLETVIPMILGANIGTSITSTLVSLGHITRRNEYRKAIAAATVHDLFNIFGVLLIFPLELMFGILSSPASWLAKQFLLTGQQELSYNLLSFTIRPVTHAIIDTIAASGLRTEAVPTLLIPLAIIGLFLSLRGLTGSLKILLIGKIHRSLKRFMFGNEFKALGWGTLLTAMVQSSSVTTSLIVPLVASGKVSLSKAFPFLMGANIGTTTTALIAAILTTSGTEAGLAVGFAHFLFNLLAVMFIFPLPLIRRIPMRIARHLGNATLKNRLVGIAYIIVIFFLVPLLLIISSRKLNHNDDIPKAYQHQRIEHPENP